MQSRNNAVTSLADPGTVAAPGVAVDGVKVLERVAALPVSIWRYQWDPDQVCHLGPMSEDWYAAFGLGQDDTAIDCVDAQGVALVAIQALHREIVELRRALDALRTTGPGCAAPAGP
ncbi:hypothetical protein ACFY2W_15525 [Streptomyces sp. NPDC001262]|uniref:hypothetical protein n=1 Tax=unclassified Streptomyces TaxID=2593676 RepID=UPI00369593D7